MSCKYCNADLMSRMSTSGAALTMPPPKLAMMVKAKMRIAANQVSVSGRNLVSIEGRLLDKCPLGMSGGSFYTQMV